MKSTNKNQQALNSIEDYSKVTILNSLGQEIPNNFSTQRNGNVLEFNVNSFKSGLYFVRVTNEKSKLVYRFIKK